MNIALVLLIAFAAGLIAVPLVVLGLALLSATPFYVAGLLGGVSGQRYKKHRELAPENGEQNSVVEDVQEFNESERAKVA